MQRIGIWQCLSGQIFIELLSIDSRLSANFSDRGIMLALGTQILCENFVNRHHICLSASNRCVQVQYRSGSFRFTTNKKTRRFHRGFFLTLSSNLAAVIHIILNWVRGHAVAVLFFLLQIEIAFDLILGEHAAFGEEFMVSLE